MWSINHLMFGARKVWWAVSTSDFSKLAALGRKFLEPKHALPSTEKCQNYLRHKQVIFNPLALTKHGIDVYWTFQKAGEAVIIPAGMAHGGFNEDLNLAEAVNFMLGESRSWQIGLSLMRRFWYNRCLQCANNIHIDMTELAERMRRIQNKEYEKDVTAKQKYDEGRDAYTLPPAEMLPAYVPYDNWIPEPHNCQEWDNDANDILRTFCTKEFRTEDGDSVHHFTSLKHRRMNDAEVKFKMTQLLTSGAVYVNDSGEMWHWTGDLEIIADQLSFRPLYVFQNADGSSRRNFKWLDILDKIRKSQYELLSSFFIFFFFFVALLLYNDIFNHYPVAMRFFLQNI